jgi:hypothetical protein
MKGGASEREGKGRLLPPPCLPQIKKFGGRGRITRFGYSQIESGGGDKRLT